MDNICQHGVVWDDFQADIYFGQSLEVSQLVTFLEVNLPEESVVMNFVEGFVIPEGSFG
jgi:hypothetical protein